MVCLSNTTDVFQSGHFITEQYLSHSPKAEVIISDPEKPVQSDKLITSTTKSQRPHRHMNIGGSYNKDIWEKFRYIIF